MKEFIINMASSIAFAAMIASMIWCWARLDKELDELKENKRNLHVVD